MMFAQPSQTTTEKTSTADTYPIPKMIEFTVHDPDQKSRSLSVSGTKRVLPPLPTSPEGLLQWSVVEILQQWPHLEAELKKLGIPTQGYRATSLESLRATLIVHQLEVQSIAKKLFKHLP